MKKFNRFAFATILAMGLVACGDDDGNSGDDIDAGDIVLPPDAMPAGPDAAPMVRCDTTNQTGCADPMMDKCTVNLDAMNTWTNVCRIETGMIAEGAACAREAEGAAGVGRDDCVAGAYCTALGNPDGSVGPGARFCRTFCNSTAACTGKTCFALTNLAPPDGICIDTCAPFVTPGVCTGGAWCNPDTDIQGGTVGFCIQAGTKTEGQECPMGDECAANLICITDANMANNCRQLCSPTIMGAPACPTMPMTTCMGINGLPTDVGVCLAM